MAASMLCRRTAMLCGTSCPKTVLSAASRGGFLLQTASYNPRPLKLNLHQPYIPDKTSEKTPEWQKTPRYDRKLFGRYGSASGIDPASLWPNHEQLEKIIEEEKEWNPPLEVMLKNIRLREKKETAKRLEREKIIAGNMAKMPKMIEDWRREKRETTRKQKEEKARRLALLEVARERYGAAIHPSSPKFLVMIEEIEKEERKKKKLIKRRLKEEEAAAEVAVPVPITPPAASS